MATELARIDPAGAIESANAIADPAVRARALREMSAQLAGSDPELADTVLADALSAAREIGDLITRYLVA